MTIELLLVRHGNTFAPGDRIVWVGKGEDLPLVPSGRKQAEALGKSLRSASWVPSAILSGGLKRQIEHLRIAAPEGSPDPVQLDALDELDYGHWGGRTTDEIIEQFGPDEVTAWNERSVWPRNAGWPESEAQVRARVHALLERVAEGEFGDRVLVCSSNGLLRWFLDAVPGALQSAIGDGTFKVKTGRVGRLVRSKSDPGGGWMVTLWNHPPDAIGLRR